jgi:HlyD family secretion protein
MKAPPLRLLAALAFVLVALSGYFLYSRRDRTARYLTAGVDRGDVVETVGATGNLQAVVTVQVGSQVSGTIFSLGADFNDVVKKGQVVARLDPAIFEARVGQMRANLVSARANVEKARANVSDGKQKYERARELHAEQLVPDSDLETAKATYDGAVADLRASEAAVSQAEANVNQAQLDLDHSIIQAPIDGVIINRSVDVGQTVAASFQAPVLFVIANNLSQMEVNAAVDEADIGHVQPGQDVTFRVDAYPDRSFPGRVDQVRLQPQTIQNVVSYNTIIAVDNAERKLMPGMTATVSIIVAEATNVLRVPAAALRFRPDGQGGGRPRPSGERAAAPAAPSPAVPSSAVHTAAGSAEAGDGAGRAPAATDKTSPSGGRPGTVYILGDVSAKPEPVHVRLGVSDGQFVEVKDGVAEGARVVTGVEGGLFRPSAPTASPTPANPFNPAAPPRRQR